MKPLPRFCLSLYLINLALSPMLTASVPEGNTTTTNNDINNSISSTTDNSNVVNNSNSSNNASNSSSNNNNVSNSSNNTINDNVNRNNNVNSSSNNNNNTTGSIWPFTRSTLAGYMDVLCPYDTICRDGEPALTIPDGRFGSCCTECSCDKSCGLTERCCFPDPDFNNAVDRTHQECLTPTTSPYSYPGDGKDFYMIADRFPGGSGEDCGNDHVTCGNDVIATLLGSLYPVSSRKTGRIYKNMKCAKCHGVGREDMVVWDAVMMCEYYGGVIRPDLGTFVDFLDHGRRYPYCYFFFYYPGDYADIEMEKCYENTIQSCLYNTTGLMLNYDIPEQLNMSETDVRDACLSKFASPYIDKYFNVFCFICNFKQFDAEDLFYKLNTGRGPFDGDDARHFAALIDPHVVKQKSAENGHDFNDAAGSPLACRRLAKTELDTRDCRPLLCPSGQIRIRAKCVYPTSKLISIRFAVAIKLTPRETTPASFLDNLKARMESGAPWTDLIIAPKSVKQFELSQIVYNSQLVANGSESEVTYIWAKFVIAEKKKRNFKHIVGYVRQGLGQDWSIVSNGSTLLFVPDFSEFGSIFPNLDMSLWKPVYHIFQSFVDYTSRFVDKFELVSIYSGLIYDAFFLITKSFVCDQVALNADEYALDPRSGILYVNSTGRIYSNLEFSIGFSVNGDYVPRMCLSDAGFDVLSTMSDVNSAGKGYRWCSPCSFVYLICGHAVFIFS